MGESVKFASDFPMCVHILSLLKYFMENSRSLHPTVNAFTRVRLLTSIASILMLLAPDLALAADRYWFGGSGAENCAISPFDNTACWGDAYGETAGGETVPGAGDNVFFDRVAGGKTIHIRRDTTIGSLNFGALFTGTLMVFTGSKLRIAGNGASHGIRMGSGYFIINGTGALSFTGSLIQTGGVIGNGHAGSVMQISGSLITVRRGRFRYSGTIVFEGERDQTFAYSGSTTPTAPSSIAVGRNSFSGITVNSIGASAGGDDIIVSGATLKMRNLVITNGNFNLAGDSANTEGRRPAVVLAASGGITIANDADAMFSTNANVTLSGSISTGAAGMFAMSGATTLTMNGIRQNLDISGANGQGVHTLVIASTSGAYLTATALVTSSLTINTSSILTFAANTLNLTGGVITNNGSIRENTGKLVHTGATFFITNSAFDAQDTEVKTGETMYFTLTECDENIEGGTVDTVTITVSIPSGDSETVTLSETSAASCIFRGNVVTENAATTAGDGKLQTTAEKIVTATFSDAQDALSNTDTTIFTAIGTSSATSTNSGGGSSRSRGGGGGGGGGGGKISVPVTPRVPEPKNVPKKNVRGLTAKQRMEARKAARIAAHKRMSDRKAARLNKKSSAPSAASNSRAAARAANRSK